VFIWCIDVIFVGYYEVKVVYGLLWDESYGVGGVVGGVNIGFDVLGDGVIMIFLYVLVIYVLMVLMLCVGVVLDFIKVKVYWVVRDFIVWLVSVVFIGMMFECLWWWLYWLLIGGLVVDDEVVIGGLFVVFIYDFVGLFVDVVVKDF